MNSTNPSLLRHNPVLHALFSMMLLLCLCGTATAQTSAARVMAVAGNAKAIDLQGKERLLEKGGEVHAGDRIVTGENALVQLRLNDGGYMSVRAGTDMVIDRFVYDEKDASKSNFLVSLLKGGFRSITGLIGRTNPNAYQIRAGTATLGIRGTDHEPMMIPADVPTMAKLGAPGLYDKVNEGETFIRNAGGLLALKRGEIGFSPINTDRPPQPLRIVPEFYKIDVKVDARDPKDGTDGGNSTRKQTTSTDGDGLLRPSTAARRAAIESTDKSVIDTSKTLVSPTSTVVAPTTLGTSPTTTLVAPTTTLVAPTTTLVAPTTTLVAPTTTLIAPTTTLVAPTTTLVAPTTTLVAPTTTLIAPTTTLVAPTTTLVAPTTTITPKITTTIQPR